MGKARGLHFGKKSIYAGAIQTQVKTLKMTNDICIDQQNASYIQNISNRQP